ncbi:hypothetical protein evm_008059 [Chilo suppressalis]|nr:hypothetical protein evm_008059 [Chilo suppressalis]
MPIDSWFLVLRALREFKPRVPKRNTVGEWRAIQTLVLLNTLGFEPEELVGKSLYDYHHAADSAGLAQQFKSLFSKGQCETGQYRFLAKSGGYAWVQTQATVINDKQQKPVSVVCVNYVIR